MKKIPLKNPHELMKPSNDYMLPHLSIPHTALPESKSWQVGKSYDLHVRVKQISSREGENTYKVTHVGTSKPGKTKKASKKSSKRYMLAHSY